MRRSDAAASRRRGRRAAAALCARALAEPGERWSYSNTIYLLLGLAIERATQSTVGREMHRRLLEFARIAFDDVVATGERGRGAPHGTEKRQT